MHVYTLSLPAIGLLCPKKSYFTFAFRYVITFGTKLTLGLSLLRFTESPRLIDIFRTRKCISFKPCYTEFRSHINTLFIKYKIVLNTHRR